MLISYVKRRKSIENSRSIRKKLDKLEAEIKDKDGGKSQARDQGRQIQ